MKVYVILKSEGDGCSYSWEEIEYIYLNEDRADWECLLLNEKVKEGEDIQYYVQEYPVDTSALED